MNFRVEALEDLGVLSLGLRGLRGFEFGVERFKV